MTLVIFFLPLFLLLYVLCVGRKLGSSGSIFLACFVSLVQMVAAFFLYVECFVLKATLTYELRLFTIFDGYDFVFSLLVDRLTASMIFIVTIISFCVQIYSIEYLKDDPHRTRFHLYLHLFTFFMLMLVLSPNYFQLFLGWEGVGLTSYLLINFWYTRTQANKSGLKALFINRIGDFFYMFALFICLIEFRTTDFTLIVTALKNEHLQHIDFSAQVICVFFIIAAVAKSAQFGLHTWLPDAMEGPTPVSALIHAATMVTAGVFLLLRVAPILAIYPIPSIILVYVGSFTAFFAATTAACQFDLKKVIAYSTCSQLGYMMASIGVGGYDTCLYHLVNHAFFKALLFLTAGIVIHAVSNEQDLRFYGGLIRLLPYCYILMLVGSLGLTGFPFISGYYSKDNLLEIVLVSGSYPMCYMLLVLTAAVTAFYSVRTIYLVFAETPRFPLSSTKHLTDGEVLFLFPTGFLFFMTMFHGFIVKDMYTGLGSTLYPELPYSLNMPGEFGLTTGDKLIPLIFSFLGALISMILYYDLAKYGLIKRTSLKILTIFRFFNKRWWFDYLDTFSFRTALRGSYNFFSSVEKGHNESISSNIVSQTLQTIGNKFMLTFQNGFLHVFLTYIVLFFALIVAYKLNDPTLIPIFYAYRVSKKNRK